MTVLDDMTQGERIALAVARTPCIVDQKGGTRVAGTIIGFPSGKGRYAVVILPKDRKRSVRFDRITLDVPS